MAKKKKDNHSKPQPLSEKQIIKERGRKMPLESCYISKNWQEIGEAMVIIFKKIGGDNYVMGAYLLDVFCLGLKDTYYHILDGEKLGLIKEDVVQTHDLSDFTFAQNLIYGAIEYSEDLGFLPASGFGTTQYLLEDIEEIAYMEIEFGKNGKPLYIQAEDDRNANHVLKTLERTVGAGNFEYVLIQNHQNNQNQQFSLQEKEQNLLNYYYDELGEEIQGLDEEEQKEFELDARLIAAVELFSSEMNRLPNEDELGQMVGYYSDSISEQIGEAKGFDTAQTQELRAEIQEDLLQRVQVYIKSMDIMKEGNPEVEWIDVLYMTFFELRVEAQQKSHIEEVAFEEVDSE